MLQKSLTIFAIWPQADLRGSRLMLRKLSPCPMPLIAIVAPLFQICEAKTRNRSPRATMPVTRHLGRPARA